MPTKADCKLPGGVFERPIGSRIFWIRFTDADGNPRCEKAASKSNAIKLLDVRHYEKLQGKLLEKVTAQKKLLFADLIGDAIEHDFAAGGTVKKGVGHRGDGFDRWVQGQEIPFLALLREGLDSSVLPDVGPVAAELAKLDVISVWALALAEDKNQLMLRAVEAAHSTLVLDPHAEVEEVVTVLFPSGDKSS